MKNLDLYIIRFAMIALPVSTVVLLPVYVFFNGVAWQDIIILVVGWILAGMGITVGYHRLFAHRSFKTHAIIEWILMLMGSMALQNTIVKWCSDHRRHHKKLDTDDDPYSITKGFFHAHIGWILNGSDTAVSGVDDLLKKSSVRFQNKYYWYIGIFLSFALPLMLGFLYGRPFGGLLWGGIVRVTIVHHFTFLINSLCHFIGDKSYDSDISARDSWFTALMTFGEGYHNYHHKFQFDYRNGIRWYNFDPSKWLIRFLSFFSLAHSLKVASEWNIYRARLDTLNRKIKNISNHLTEKSSYNDRAQLIMNDALSKLNSWKALERRYEQLSKSKSSLGNKFIFDTKKKMYKMELKNCMSSLMIILINLRASV